MSWFTPEVIDVILTVLRAIVVLLAVVVCGALLSFVERRLLGWWQDRYGPNRVGPFGKFQIAADMLKMFFKEDWNPPFVDRVIFTLAPVVAMSALLIAFVVIPITPVWGVADLNIGLLFFFAMAGLSVYAVLFAGWSSNNKYALLGGLRSSAQMVSYEISMGMSLIPVLLLAGNVTLSTIVNQQAQMHLWNVLTLSVSYLLFHVAAFAETNRLPFDMPESETDLVGGYHTEYSSFKFGFFFVGEYANMTVGSCVVALLFLGGWHPLPGFTWTELAGLSGWDWLDTGVPGALISFATFAAKALFVLFFFIWVRWTVPRFRYDQVMRIGWRGLLPVAIFNLVLYAIGITLLDHFAA